MKAQLFGALRTLRVHQDQIAIAYFCLAALSWKYRKTIRLPFVSSTVIAAAVTLAIAAIFVYILSIVIYVLHPNYFDHIEPVVASISWLWIQGHELYPNWTTDNVYISIYGPLTFFINGLALLLHPSVVMSKLPGVLSLFAGLVAISIVLKRITGSHCTSLVLLGTLVILLGTFGAHSYWTRPEPFLFLVSALALLTITFRLSSLVTAIVIGFLAGTAVGFKLHGFVYLIPAAAVGFARVGTLRGRIVTTAIGSACAVASALIPYFGNNVSIIGYLRFLNVVLDERWSMEIFVENLLVACALAAPIVVLRIWGKQAHDPTDRWLFAALGLSASILVLIGAKEGAGIHYLLPLAPSWIYGIAACATSQTKAKAEGAAALVLVCYFLAYSPNLLFGLRGLKYAYFAAPAEREKIAELKAYLASYPDAQFGVSDDAHYSGYFYRVLSVWNGRPLYADFTVWMDFAYTGVNEEHILRLLRGCTVQTWILPLGTPFTKENWYNNQPLLSENFRRTFSANYRQIETGQAYQVWKCKQ
jgi:hypothetical protein